jgi:vacuolar protein sorting-associated protein 13A/C
MGIVKGAASLIKNTLAGAFNSVNKITGAVSTGLASLTMVLYYFL